MGCCEDTRDFCVGAGETFAPVIRWGAKDLTTAQITGITQGTPVVITAPAHGVPNGWPVAIVGTNGMYEINATRYPPVTKDYNPASVLSVDSLALNDISSAKFQPYRDGGAVVFNTPISLVGVSAAMTFWDTPDKSDTPLVVLTNGSGLTLDTVDFTVVPQLQTAGLLWQLAYFNLDFTDTNGVVTRALTGTLTIN